MTGRADETESTTTQIDTLLRRTLRDDPPPDVRAKLDRAFERFVDSRDAEASTSGAGVRRWLAAVASLLLACGFGLHAAQGKSDVSGALADLSSSWRLTAAMRDARALHCEPTSDGWLLTPQTAAEHLFRRLVPVRATPLPDGRVVYEFRDTVDAVRHVLVSDQRSALPREIRSSRDRSPSGGPSPVESVISCHWETAPEPTRVIAWMAAR